ncbi:Hypothetical_protein [Hexamita inflata]|uniref:Hypothetical_protein n=1 Tax=Hexamita inflata TaxID=28002 RepID=A0AA86RAF1_9EUKA|nr:Hypothetical protein HINF_LOCUS62449 [Hexamita inflata]
MDEPNSMIDQEQPIVDHELSQSAFNLEPQNMIQPQNIIDQTKFQFSQVKAQDSIRDSPPLKSSQPFRTPIKQKTQKADSPKDMSIVSIDSDTPVNETLVTKTQKCSKKPLEPRCATTDHCFDLALRNALQKSFKKEDPEMFDRFSKKQLIEYVEKNANANDNFWRLVLSQCSQYFPDKQNSQNQLVSIKKYFLVEFSKWK